MTVANRQSRIWVCTLYLDNEEHLAAISKARNMHNSILLLHDKTPDKSAENGLKKPHYHCIFQFGDPYYLFSILDKLGLDRENNAHLFKNLHQIKFSRLEKYIVYLTHENTNKPDKYPFDNFEGGLREYAIHVCDSFDRGDEVLFNEVVFYINNGYKNGSFDVLGRTLADHYEHLYSIFGHVVFKHWNKISQMLKDIMSHYY